MMQLKTLHKIGNCIVTSQRFLYNLSMQVRVDLRKSSIKWKKNAFSNRKISLHTFDQLGHKLRAPPPQFEKTIIPALFSMLILLETVPIILKLC